MKSSILNKLRRRKRRILRRIENRPGPERERPMIAASNIHYELGVTPRNGKNCTLSVAVFEEMTNRGPADAQSPGDLPLADALLR